MSESLDFDQKEARPWFFLFKQAHACSKGTINKKLVGAVIQL